MFQVLFGNKSVEKILIFLFVNGKCYGTQLHRLLRTPLTPVQKALLRLEKGGLVLSYFEGRTRVYRFNPAFPLMTELESLLKKAYTLLPADQKKVYYVGREDLFLDQEKPESKLRVLLEFWGKLSSVNQLKFSAKSKSDELPGWNGRGEGKVVITQAKSDTLVFSEEGFWKGKEGGDVHFRNVFRWTLDRVAGVIALEHLRRGPERPVFLFYLAPTSSCALASVDSHLCEGDTYFGQIHFDRYGLRLNWRVIGPKKNEEIDYYYS